MRLNTIKQGMRLKAVGDYADCIHTGEEFLVESNHRDELFIRCDHGKGEHVLGEEFADEEGEIPELELQS